MELDTFIFQLMHTYMTSCTANDSWSEQWQWTAAAN